jgi:hypothetical protein
MAGNLNLLAGWIGVLGGVVSGAIIGLFFHREDWVGGYGSLPRRLLRLGHISFFGIGFLNFALALTFAAVSFPRPTYRWPPIPWWRAPSPCHFFVS